MSISVNVNIAGVDLAIRSDEEADFVNEIASALDKRIKEIIGKSQSYSKFDAAVLCAIDYSAKIYYAEKQIKKLEHQISLYEANNTRFKDEINELQAKYERLAHKSDTSNAAEDANNESRDLNKSGGEPENIENPPDTDEVNRQKIEEFERMFKSNS